MECVLNFNGAIDGIALGGGHVGVSSLARADTGDRLALDLLLTGQDGLCMITDAITTPWDK